MVGPTTMSYLLDKNMPKNNNRLEALDEKKVRRLVNSSEARASLDQFCRTVVLPALNKGCVSGNAFAMNLGLPLSTRAGALSGDNAELVYAHNFSSVPVSGEYDFVSLMTGAGRNEKPVSLFFTKKGNPKSSELLLAKFGLASKYFAGDEGRAADIIVDTIQASLANLQVLGEENGLGKAIAPVAVEKFAEIGRGSGITNSKDGGLRESFAAVKAVLAGQEAINKFNTMERFFERCCGRIDVVGFEENGWVEASLRAKNHGDLQQRLIAGVPYNSPDGPDCKITRVFTLCENGEIPLRIHGRRALQCAQRVLTSKGMTGPV